MRYSLNLFTRTICQQSSPVKKLPHAWQHWLALLLAVSLVIVCGAGRLFSTSASYFAGVSLTTLGTPYTQNFDMLPASGSVTWTNNSTIPGWFYARTGTGTTIVANDGSGNAGNLYSYGAGTATDRALGSVGSGGATAGNFFWGVGLVNNTGSTITSLNVSYTGEQWRNSAAAAQTIAFSYLVGSPTVTGSLAEFQTSGVAVTSLDFTSPVTGGTAAALNGNLAANRTTVTFTITGLSIPNGTEVMLRWSDPDHLGSDHGLSIDDFSVTPQGASPLPNLTINDVSLNEGNAGTTTYTFTVSLSAPAGAGGVTFDIATANGTAIAPGDYTAKSLTSQTIPAGSSTYTFSVLVNGDLTPETNETFLVNVTNVTGANVTDGQGQGTIVNDDAAPNLTINDVSLNEGNAGTTTFTYTASLSTPAPAGGVTFDIATADGTATAPGDYTAKSLTTQTIPAGSSTYTFDVLVNGDMTVEPNETFFVNVTNVTNAILVDGQGLGTIVNDDFTRIHDIQGSGMNSPLVSTTVTTQGIVTGIRSNGFFIQEPDASVDADPNTSEGIFVFTSSAPPAAAALGNLVQVAGTVQEFIPSSDPLSPPVTEIGTSPTVSLISSGNALPAAVTLTLGDTGTGGVNSGSIENLEKYEGMRVRVASLTVVAATGGTVNEPNATSTSNGAFYGVITGVARPFREPGIQANDPVPPGSGVMIPPVPRFDFNPERLRVDSDGLVGAAKLDVTTGATIANVVGPLDYAFRTYTILPDPGTLAQMSVIGNVGATPVPTPLSNEFTVSSFNMERFFDTVDDPGVSDVMLTATAFANRLNKASLAIRNVLNFPDILGIEEMENLATLQAVANKVNNDAVAASQPNPNYVAYLIEGNDVGGIDVGFLVKTAIVAGSTPRVTVNAVVQEGKDTTYINPNNGQPELLNDRPPLRLMAVVNHPDGRSFPITVIVVHQRSLSRIDDSVDGNRVRTKRRAQSEFLANLIQARQAADLNERIIAVGDFNAFEFNDGYVDVIGTIKGTPTPANQVVLASPDLVNPDLTDLVSLAASGQNYSYSFDGDAQTIDHELANAALLSFFSHINFGRTNADFPEIYRNDATRPERLSDHDPAVAYFLFPSPPDLTIAKTHTGNFTIGATGQYTITVSNNAAAGATSGTITVTDTLPSSLTLASFSSLGSGTAWNCTGTGTANVSCTNAGPLAAGSSLPVLTLTVNVGAGTPTGTNSITNTASVATPGESNTANNSSSNPTTIACPVITISPATIPTGTVDTPYSQAFSAAFNSPIGLAPPLGNSTTLIPPMQDFTFTLTGTLPNGLAFIPDFVFGPNFAGSLITGTPTEVGAFNFTIKATSISNGTCMGSRDYTLLVQSTTPTVTARIADPLACTGTGNLVNVTATVTNNATTAQAASFTATLQSTLLAVPGTCAVNVGSCSVLSPSSVSWAGTLAAGQTVTINYQAQVNDGVLPGAQLCVASVATVGNSVPATVTACGVVNCPAIGPGTLPAATSPVNDQKAGSVLIFNIYTSSTNPIQQNTRIALTNTNPALPVFVHLFFVDGTSCSVADSILCLTANQTTSFLASDLDPGSTGYIVAVAVDANGCPTNFNFLIGDEYVKFASGHAANLGAEAITAIAGGLPFCNSNSVTAQLNFDGVSYNPVPRMLAADNIPARADGNDTLLILNRIGGNLGIGASTLINLFGILYDDSEAVLSFGFGGSSSSPGTCQFRGSLSNAFPRVTPRFEQFIPAGRSGWAKIFSQADIGLLGAVINFNANAGTSAGAFNQGHNLHKLTLTTTSNYVIPVFPPGC